MMIVVEDGQLYRVVKVPPGEYLTLGAVYRASFSGGRVVGLHRPVSGIGTFLPLATIRRGVVILERVLEES